jgi:hypothetical protein
MSGGALSAYGDFAITAGFTGTDTTLTFKGSANQSYTDQGAYPTTGAVTVSKSAGQVILLSTMTFNAVNQILNVASGTINLNGYNLTASTLTVGASGNVQLNGDETMTIVSTNIISGSSFTYVGTAGLYTLKNFAYSNLTINGGAATEFSLPASLSTINHLTISTGILNLRGYDLTAATLSNDGTFRWRGDESVVITGGNDTDSGTWEYMGDGDLSGDLFTVKDFGASDYFNLVLTSTNTADQFRLAAALDVNGSLTISSSTLHTSASNRSINVAGNWTKTTGGTFTANSSTVTFDGAATQTLSGNTTFYGLRAMQSGATLYFTPGSTQYATNMVDFENVRLRSVVDNAT